MIAVDTSAVMAVLLGEDSAERIKQCLSDEAICMSAGTLAELLIVAEARNVGEEAAQLIQAIGAEIVVVDGAAASGIRQAFLTWGKGRHKASLNFGDCFAYALAKSRGIPLLYVGKDFARTDISAVDP